MGGEGGGYGRELKGQGWDKDGEGVQVCSGEGIR